MVWYEWTYNRRTSYSTIDSIFILNSIIMKYLSKKGGVFLLRIYWLFQSIRYINRSKLFYVLLCKDLHGRMIHLLQNIYSHAKAEVKSKDGLTICM
jgi:hypothetical protein